MTIHRMVESKMKKSVKKKNLGNSIVIHLLSPTSPSRPSQSFQLEAVHAHTARALAPPDPIRAGGPNLRYQMRLGDTMIKQSLASRPGEASRRECV